MARGKKSKSLLPSNDNQCITTNSILLLLALPSLVVLGAIGIASPYPLAINLFELRPILIRYPFTELALA